MGFGVVELAVALAVGSVIVVSAVPRLNTMQQAWALWGGARLVESSLQWGRMRAIAANTSVAFQVSSDGRQFGWTDPVSGLQYEGTVRNLPSEVRIVDKPSTPLRFYQKGNAVPAGTYVIQNEAGTWRVIVSPSGRIRIQRG